MACSSNQSIADGKTQPSAAGPITYDYYQESSHHVQQEEALDNMDMSGLNMIEPVFIHNL